MARRDLPYLPLYVQDFLTDEKLRECSASSVGVYIMMMCVMHKQEEYGTILLRDRDCQHENIIQDFAIKLAKHLPFEVTTIADALQELLDEDVIQCNGHRLLQKRMVRDDHVSDKRASAGKKGATSTNTKFAATKETVNDPDSASDSTYPEEVPDVPEGTSEDDRGSGSMRGVYEEIATLYNQICSSFPKLKSLSEARKKAIKARLATGYTVDSFRELFQKAEASSFLRGKNDRNWRATFDWLIKDSNMAKVIDGNFTDHTDKGGKNNGAYETGGFTADPTQFQPSSGFGG